MKSNREQQNTVIASARKQMGAYYTGDDIAAYISKNTILPFFFDTVRQKYPEAFADDGFIGALLRAHPERYMYEAMRKGYDLPLPCCIEDGIDDVTRRGAWNRLAPAEYALPLETWREVVARRTRCAELKAAISAGVIRSFDDLITWNLDVCRFALDVIAHCEESGLLLALYESIERITILDPTCGSGAFLLAALHVLEPLYEACMKRMQGIVEEYACSEAFRLNARSACVERFRAILREAGRYPCQHYFIDQSIITHNLYGVDIMEEATKTCRTSLLLKMLSKLGTPAERASLPVLDCNIRTGNALVGFTTSVACPTSAALGDDLRSLLDGELAAACGLDCSRAETGYDELLASWRRNHRPFHWCVEFQEIMQRGGFDVILGNPPYVAESKMNTLYQVQGYETQSCGNLYAYTLERALKLLRPGGRCGMIVPVSAIAGERFRPMSHLLLERRLWVSSYSNRPGKLFTGVEQRLAILLLSNTQQPALFSSPYRHWYEPERMHLFETLSYVAASTWERTGMPLKSGTARAEAIFARLSQHQGFPLLDCPRGEAAVWVHNGPTYWVRALPFEPNVGQKSAHSNHYYRIPVSSQNEALLLAAILGSSTFYFFYKLVSNCRDLGRKELRLFPLGRLCPEVAEVLVKLGGRLAERLKETAVQCSRRYPSGLITYEEYYPASAKPILDEIDRALAGHYGFTEAELDFIVNHDLKYRMGRGSYL